MVTSVVSSDGGDGRDGGSCWVFREAGYSMVSSLSTLPLQFAVPVEQVTTLCVEKDAPSFG